jgi:broad specificity phosphatase PhoE
MPGASIEEDGDLMEWDYGAYEGRRTVDIQVERPGWRLFRNGCPDGERVEDVGARADRVIERIRGHGGTFLLFGHRDILRILAVRWLGLAPNEGFHFQLGTATVSVLGYDHDLGTPVVHTWNTTGASSRP